MSTKKMKAKLYISETEEMTHDELARVAARVAAANGDDDLAALAADLREAVDDERDSTPATEAIRKYISAGGAEGEAAFETATQH